MRATGWPRAGSSKHACRTPPTRTTSRCTTTKASAARSGWACVTTGRLVTLRCASQCDATAALARRAARHRLLRAWLVGCSGLFLAAAVQAQSAIEDDRGATLHFAAPPQRIVSLVPSLTESGVRARRLPAAGRHRPTRRTSRRRCTRCRKLGGLDDAQVERIVALAPDVVLAAPHARVVDAARSARRAGAGAAHPQPGRGAAQPVGARAQLLGEPARAEQQWQQIEAQLARAAARVPAAMRGRSVYFEVDSSPYAAGAASFIGQTLQRLGLHNIAAADARPLSEAEPRIRRARQPADRHRRSACGGRHGARGRAGRACRRCARQQVCAFAAADYELLVRPGPRLGDAALQVADCLVRLGRTLP